MMLHSSSINVLKVTATLLVFFCHSTITATNEFNYELHGVMKLFNTPAWGGVFMFFTISGLLAGYGFSRGRYKITRQGVGMYYRSRFLKVLLPTWVFLTLAYIFTMQESTLEVDAVIRWLTCTSNGGGSGIKAVGATWYVFILMWLYLLSPFFAWVLNKIEENNAGREKKCLIELLVAVSLIGLTYRLVGHFVFDLDWYNWLYANVIAAADLFLIGMIGERIIGYSKLSKNGNIRIKLLLMLFLTIVILLSRGGIQPLGILYRYIFPTFYALLTIGLVAIYSLSSQKQGGVISSVCNYISPYSFMFYLWHSMILMYIALKTDYITSDTSRFFATLIGGFLVTAYISFLMTRMNNSVLDFIDKNDKK